MYKTWRFVFIVQPQYELRWKGLILKSEDLSNKDTPSKALCSAVFAEGRKEISISLTKTGKTGTKRTNGWYTSKNPASKRGLHHKHTQAHCSLRPSRSPKHIFLSNHVNNKTARIFSWGRIWLLKLCHCHEIFGDLIDLTMNSLSLK